MVKLVSVPYTRCSIRLQIAHENTKYFSFQFHDGSFEYNNTAPRAADAARYARARQGKMHIKTGSM